MKTRHSLLALLVASLLLVAALALPASAATVPVASDSTADIRISNVSEGETFDVYKIVDISYLEASNSATFAFNSAVKPYFDSIPMDMQGYSDALNISDANAITTDSGLALYVRANNVPILTSATMTAENLTLAGADANGSPIYSYTFENLPLGRYLILGSGGEQGVYIYQPMAVSIVPVVNEDTNTYVLEETYERVSKRTVPSIVKTVTDTEEGSVPGKHADVGIGDEVTFTFTVDRPEYIENAYRLFRLGDSMTSGLKFVTGSMKVYGVVNGAEPVLLAEGTNYKVNSQNDTAFELELSDDHYADKNYYATVLGYNKITVTYKALITSAIAVENDTAKNTATLIYNNNPFTNNDHQEMSDDAEVQTYKVNVFKFGVLDASVTDPANGTALAGVKFMLYDTVAEDEAGLAGVAPMAFSQITPGYYRILSAGEVDENSVTELVTATDGYFHIDGLDVGSYTLRETATLDGYAMPANPITQIQVTRTVSTVNVANTATTFNLPQTGGAGTWMFTLGGLVLMCCAVGVLLAYRKRMLNH